MARGGNSGDPLRFTCPCGQLAGHITGAAARRGTHVVCFCKDCRAAELYLDQPDPAPGPVDLFQTMPDSLTITKGAHHLGLFRLSPRGTFRWYATCCKTALFNTATTPKFPFVSISTARIDAPERTGPVIAQAHMPRPGGKTSHKGLTRVVWKLLPQVLATRLSGRWKETPFFDTETGEPAVPPTVLSKEERVRLYPA